MVELLITVAVGILLISAFLKLIDIGLSTIGTKVFEHNMKEDLVARESAYNASFENYMRELKSSELGVHKAGASGWITRNQYQAYLESDQWKAIATNRLQIDNFICQYCGSSVVSKKNDWHCPNIHHFHYRNIMHENVYDDLVTLCKVCHTNLHQDYSIKDMEVEIKTHGFAYK